MRLQQLRTEHYFSPYAIEPLRCIQGGVYGNIAFNPFALMFG